MERLLVVCWRGLERDKETSGFRKSRDASYCSAPGENRPNRAIMPGFKTALIIVGVTVRSDRGVLFCVGDKGDES